MVASLLQSVFDLTTRGYIECCGYAMLAGEGETAASDLDDILDGFSRIMTSRAKDRKA
jgi:hypothetical protein